MALADLFHIFPYMEDIGDDPEYDWEPVDEIDFSRDGFYYAYNPEWGFLGDHKDLGVYVVDGKIYHA